MKNENRYVVNVYKIFFILPIMSMICICNVDNNKKFPELKPSSKLENDFIWQFKNGPDFYVYSGTVDSNSLPFVGIYFGLYPNLKAQEKSEKSTGIIAGEKIMWSTVTNSDLFEQEVVFLYKHSPNYFDIKIHVWIVGKSINELTKLKEKLKDLKFIERNNENNKGVQ
jgi:hypothetical protein